MPAWAVRMETKLDLALTTQTDHESRMRVLEARRCVTPQGLWAAVVSGSAVMAAMVGVAARLAGT